jgi:putative transposase
MGSGLPRAIRCDNGPELTSRHFLAWALDRKPGKPTQNPYVESFNSKVREDCLRVSWFPNLFEARRIIAAWRRDYNERRPETSRMLPEFIPWTIRSDLAHMY